MGKNIYTLKFNEIEPVEEMINDLAKALDNNYPIVHHENEEADLIIEETKMVLGNYGSAINSLGITGLIDLNSRVTEMYQRQAKYILKEISEKTGNTEYLGMITDSGSHINGEKFKEIFKKIAYKENTNDLLIDNPKSYFKESCDIDTYDDLDEEMLESDKDIISYNLNWYPKDEEERKNIALDTALLAFDCSTEAFDEIIEKINKSNNPKKEIIDAFKKYVSQKMNELSVEDRSEDKFFDIQMNFSSAFKVYSERKMDYDPTKYIKEYITADKDYKVFGYSLINKDIILDNAKADFALAIHGDEEHLFDEISIDDAVDEARTNFATALGLTVDNVFYDEPIDENNPPTGGFRKLKEKIALKDEDAGIILPAEKEKGLPERTKLDDNKRENVKIDMENNGIHNHNISVYEKAIKKISDLEETHRKRGFFTRFIDWFRSDGEASTIKEMKNYLANNLPSDLIEKGYSKEKIEEDLKKEKLDKGNYKSAIVQIKHLESYRDALKAGKNSENVKEINNTISKYKNIVYGKGYSNSQINNDIKNADLGNLLFYGVDQSIAMLKTNNSDVMPFITIKADEKLVKIQEERYNSQNKELDEDKSIEQEAQEDRRELTEDESSILMDDVSENNNEENLDNSIVKVFHNDDVELDDEDEYYDEGEINEIE